MERANAAHQAWCGTDGGMAEHGGNEPRDWGVGVCRGSVEKLCLTALQLRLPTGSLCQIQKKAPQSSTMKSLIYNLLHFNM